MRRSRWLALLALTLLTVGSLAATTGYAWYLRSDHYRHYCAASLSEYLGLPSDIGRVIPRSCSSREFDNVDVWLPGRRDRALACQRALLVHTPRPDDPDAYEITLLGGTCEISTRTWLREDYRRVLESGLLPGFDPQGPRRVIFSGMDLRFAHDRFRGALCDASGVVEFATAELGRAAAHCSALNGHVASQPIALTACFSPRAAGIQVDELTLRVPELPLAVLELQDLVGAELRSGTFSGELAYQEGGGVRRTRLSGRCRDLNLSECTAGFLQVPWRGAGREIELEELTLENGRPQRLRFRGVLTGVVLSDVLAPWGLAGMGGELVLRVRQADLSRAGIERLVAAGHCENVSLEALTRELGWGRMSGTARLVIDDLTVEHNRLSSMNAEFRIAESAVPDWIEGQLLTELIGRALNVDLPPVLPDRVEYTRLGFRLDVRDEVLYVFGTHGPREKTILTVRLFEREVPLLSEPERPFELSGWFDQLRAQAAAHMEQLDRVTPTRTWQALSRWPGWRPPTGTQPGRRAPDDPSLGPSPGDRQP